MTEARTTRDETRTQVQIRDPIHGSISLSRAELAIVDHRAFQRLRTIKQLGLADLAFPGATHTRYSHALGAMQVASRMAERLLKPYGLAEPDRARLLSTVRLAALLHDLGHPPLSHTTEAFMPPVEALRLGPWADGSGGRPATHEDYTIKLLVDSDLTDLLRERFGPSGVVPEDVACLITGPRGADQGAGTHPSAEGGPQAFAYPGAAGGEHAHTHPAPLDCRPRSEAGRAADPDVGSGSTMGSFVVGGRDWMPALRQCVSSELDADRMDYLLRDSYFAGVPYGRYDIEWILENLVPVEQGDRVCLGLNARASFGFEDFLLSRYHMFMSVYFHHVPVGYEVMLRRLFEESQDELALPADVDRYLEWDDVHLLGLLRRSDNRWARRVVDRRPYRMLVETKELVEVDGDRSRGEPRQAGEARDLRDLVDPIDRMQRTDRMDRIDRIAEQLRAARIDFLPHSVQGKLSKYIGSDAHGAASLSAAAAVPSPFILDGARALPVEVYVPLYRRYAGAIRLRRIYVDPERLVEARALLSRAEPGG